MSIKNLIFDVDGTLWDSTEIVAQAWSQGCSDLLQKQVLLTPKRLQSEFGKTMEEIGSSLFPEYNKAMQVKLMEQAMEYEHRYLEEQGAKFYPTVLETLPILAANYNLYIVSNAQLGYIELVMDKGNFASLIKGHLCYGATGRCKGDNIAQLMATYGLAKDETLYLGDIEGDNLASHAAGIKMIYCSYGFGDVPQPDYKVDAMAEVPALLDIINEQRK